MALTGRVSPEGFAAAVLFSETVAAGCKSFDVLTHPTIIMSMIYSAESLAAKLRNRNLSLLSGATILNGSSRNYQV